LVSFARDTLSWSPSREKDTSSGNERVNEPFGPLVVIVDPFS
jgi:hypothetical protein